jgi:transcriptional regulator with XRE-family HTH domain
MSTTQTVTATRVLMGGARGKLRQNGAAIRSLREKDGWHQPEFARKVGMSQAALSNIEREKRSARPATIHRIARALRVPVAAITREYHELEEPVALSDIYTARRLSARYGTALGITSAHIFT